MGVTDSDEDDLYAALDGLYAVRTGLPPETLAAAGAVTAYKRLWAVERAFRGLKTVDLGGRGAHRSGRRSRLRCP